MTFIYLLAAIAILFMGLGAKGLMLARSSVDFAYALYAFVLAAAAVGMVFARIWLVGEFRLTK